MFKFFKDWYESHLTDPNQVALALIILSITLITYILLSTVAPILVDIILNNEFSEAGDLDYNGVVNILDVIQLIDLILD